MRDCACGRQGCSGFGDQHFADHQFDRELDGNITLPVISENIEGDSEEGESFIPSLHLIKQGSGGVPIGAGMLAKSQERELLPAWVFDDRKVQAFILAVFPKMKTDEKQRRVAGRWARVLYLYYRMRQSDNEVGDAMGLQPGNVRVWLHYIRARAKKLGFYDNI